MKASRYGLSIIALLTILTAVAGAGEGGLPAEQAAPSKAEIGLASWYGYPYHGRTSASGEVYDMERMTAAHRTLPFGTMVRVKNLRNGKSVDVEITDRGPFVRERLMDVSYAAARILGMVNSGLARVRLELAVAEPPVGEGFFGVQSGAFRIRTNADRYRLKMENRYGAARIIPQVGKQTLWRVVVGKEASITAAASLSERLTSENPDINGAAFVVRLD